MKKCKQLLILSIVFYLSKTRADITVEPDYNVFVEHSYYNSKVIESSLRNIIKSHTDHLSDLNQIIQDIQNNIYSVALDKDFYQNTLRKHNIIINRSKFLQNNQYHDEILKIFSEQKNKILQALNKARYSLFKKYNILIGIYNSTDLHQLGASISIGTLNSIFLSSNKNINKQELMLHLFDQYHILNIRNSSIYIKPIIELKFYPEKQITLFSELLFRHHNKRKTSPVMRDIIFLVGKSIINNNIYYGIGYNISMSNIMGGTLSLYSKYSINNTENIIYNKTLYNKISYNLQKAIGNYHVSFSVGLFREELLSIRYMLSSGIVLSLCCTI